MATCCRTQHFCPNCRPSAGLFTPCFTKIASPDLLETRRPRPFWQFRDRNYLEDYELMQLRADMQNASYDELIDERRQAEWRVMNCGKNPMAGGPKFKTRQITWLRRSRQK